MRRKRNKTIVAVLLLAALLPGCKKEAPPPPPEPPKAEEPAKPAAQPPPVQGQLSSAAVTGSASDFSRRKDPFKPAIEAAPPPTPAAPGAAPSGDVLPIQSFEVARFRVVGIITGMNENKALLLDPNNKGYVVRVGMQIGNANGRIVRITPSAVEVVERFKESGRVKQRKTVLPLAKKR